MKRQRKGLNIINDEYHGKFVKLYNTMILRQRLDDTVTINHGDWITKHTVNCINDHLPLGYKVFRKKGEMYANIQGTIYQLDRPITFHWPTGKIIEME